VAEDELVEVDLEVLGRDAVVGALEPGLQVRERSVGAWQHPLAVGKTGALLTGPVVVAGGSEQAVAGPAVGVDDRVGGDAGKHKFGQRRGRGVAQELQPQTARAGTADLDGDADEWLAVALAAPAQVAIAAAE